MTPTRIQRKRTKGYKQPPNTLYMGRKNVKPPFRDFSNPFTVAEYGRDEAVRLHREMLEQQRRDDPAAFYEVLKVLRGYDYLSCWCRLDEKCHVDNWLEYLIADELERLRTERREIANSIKLPLIDGEAPDNLVDHVELLMVQEYYPMVEKLERLQK